MCERPGRGCNIAVPTCIHKGTYGKLKLIKANNRALENIVLCSVHTRKGLETYFCCFFSVFFFTEQGKH